MHEQISHSFTGMEELFMTMNAINSVNSTTNSYQTGTASKTASTSTDKTTTSDKAETGVVYEKSSQTDKDTVTKKTDYAMVAKLKADAEQRTSREFDTLKCKKVPQSLEIGLFFCQIFIFII